MNWLTQFHRNRILGEPFPEEWREFLRQEMTVFYRLLEEDRTKLEDDLRIFMDLKSWEGCGGLELTSEMKVLISAQACLLNLHRTHKFYANVESILVYPAAYRARSKNYEPGGVVSESESARLGESWSVGPIVLSWNNANEGAEDEHDGHNVVYHEFAHKLDLTDKEMDGVPLLETEEQVDDWAQVMEAVYTRLVERVKDGNNTLLDPYGATNAAEFFAVATETFFEKPLKMREELPEMYRVLQGYFKQDPASWFEQE